MPDEERESFGTLNGIEFHNSDFLCCNKQTLRDMLCDEYSLELESGGNRDYPAGCIVKLFLDNVSQLDETKQGNFLDTIQNISEISSVKKTIVMGNFLKHNPEAMKKILYCRSSEQIELNSQIHKK